MQASRPDVRLNAGPVAQGCCISHSAVLTSYCLQIRIRGPPSVPSRMFDLFPLKHLQVDRKAACARRVPWSRRGWHHHLASSPVCFRPLPKQQPPFWSCHECRGIARILDPCPHSKPPYIGHRLEQAPDRLPRSPRSPARSNITASGSRQDVCKLPNDSRFQPPMFAGHSPPLGNATQPLILTPMPPLSGLL